MKATSSILLAAILCFAAGSKHPPVADAQNTSPHLITTPLHVSASGRYFESAQDIPWFWLGDTAWSILTDYTPEEARAYLAARQRMGFSVVQTVAVWDGGTGTEKGLKPNPNAAGVQPWRSHDPLQPNEAYWQNVDAVVSTAAKDSLYVALLPAWGSYVVNYKMITATNAEAYGRWLGHRYRDAPNIIWVVGGDREFSEAPEIWRAIGRGLREGDGGSHLITFHPGGTLQNTRQEAWLAADMIQTWAWYRNIPSEIASEYARSPARPVILAEGAYEDGPEYPTRPITPLLVRRQAYWTYLCGAFFTYGHNDMWRKNPTWKVSLTSDGAKSMKVLRDIFDVLPWWELQPDQKLFASGQGSGTMWNVAAISSDRSWGMVYLSTPKTFSLHMTSVVDGFARNRVQASWINPGTGQRTPAKAASANGSQRFSTPAGWPDALLLLESH